MVMLFTSASFAQQVDAVAFLLAIILSWFCYLQYQKYLHLLHSQQLMDQLFEDQ